MNFKVLDFHEKQNVYVLKDSHGEVWWLEVEQNQDGGFNTWFINYPDDYKDVMRLGSLSAISARATLYNKAKEAIEKWKFKKDLSPGTLKTFDDIIDEL